MARSNSGKKLFRFKSAKGIPPAVSTVAEPQQEQQPEALTVCVVSRKYMEDGIPYIEFLCPKCGIKKAYPKGALKDDALVCDGTVILRVGERGFWFRHDRDGGHGYSLMCISAGTCDPAGTC